MMIETENRDVETQPNEGPYTQKQMDIEGNSKNVIQPLSEKAEEKKTTSLKVLSTKEDIEHMSKKADVKKTVIPKMLITTSSVPGTSGKKKFQCDGCPRSYSSKYDLQNHKRDVCGQDRKRIQCTKGCEKTFLNDRNRREHEGAVHTHKYVYKCSVMWCWILL